MLMRFWCFVGPLLPVACWRIHHLYRLKMCPVAKVGTFFFVSVRVSSHKWHLAHRDTSGRNASTSCRWLTIKCLSGDCNMGTKQDAPAASILLFYWADVVSTFESKIFTKIFSRTCWSVYINYVADMDTWTHTENSLAKQQTLKFKGKEGKNLVLFISSSKLCKAFLCISLTFKQTNTCEFFLVQPNTNTNWPVGPKVGAI